MVAAVEKHPEWYSARCPHCLPKPQRVTVKRRGPTPSDVDLVHLAEPDVVECLSDRLPMVVRIVDIDLPDSR